MLTTQETERHACTWGPQAGICTLNEGRQADSYLLEGLRQVVPQGFKAVWNLIRPLQSPHSRTTLPPGGHTRQSLLGTLWSKGEGGNCLLPSFLMDMLEDITYGTLKNITLTRCWCGRRLRQNSQEFRTSLPRLHSEFKDSVGYMRPCLKRERKRAIITVISLSSCDVHKSQNSGG